MILTFDGCRYDKLPSKTIGIPPQIHIPQTELFFVAKKYLFDFVYQY